LNYKISDLTIFFFDLLTGKRQASEITGALNRESDCKEYIKYENLDILDLGNGRLRPQFEILRKSNHNVWGVDHTNNCNNFNFVNIAYYFARLLFNRKIPIKGSIGKSFLTNADVANLPFEDNKFHLVTSIAAFEHFLEPDKVLNEVKRVLKKGGIFWCSFHPFTCLSGGHNIGLRLESINKIQKEDLAWDHLREQTIPFNVPLNKLRIPEVLNIFSQHFDIKKNYISTSEGANLLRIARKYPELNKYSDEELTTSCYTILAINK
jgi:SAM-dependent methyltransferase